MVLMKCKKKETIVITEEEYIQRCLTDLYIHIHNKLEQKRTIVVAKDEYL